MSGLGWFVLGLTGAWLFAVVRDLLSGADWAPAEEDPVEDDGIDYYDPNEED